VIRCLRKVLARAEIPSSFGLALRVAYGTRTGMGQPATAMCTINGSTGSAVTLMTTRVGEVQTAAAVITTLTGMATLVFQVRQAIH
jgi:hypothetical protein